MIKKRDLFRRPREEKRGFKKVMKDSYVGLKKRHYKRISLKIKQLFYATYNAA